MRIFRTKKVIWFLLFLIPFFLGTCKKRKEHLLLGVWKVIAYTLEETATPGIWKFEDSGVISIINDNPSNTMGDTAIGTYKVAMKSLVFTNVELSNNLEYQGIWRVEKLNKSILVMSRIGNLDPANKAHPYLRREFTRIE